MNKPIFRIAHFPNYIEISPLKVPAEAHQLDFPKRDISTIYR